MNPLGLAALGGALWWLSRLRVNPYGDDGGYIGGIDGKSSAVMRRLANMAGYTRSVQASARRDAKAKAEAAAREIDERERYQPVGVPRIEYKPNDFMMVPAAGGKFRRIPLRGSERPQDDGRERYGLGDGRYQDVRTKEYLREVASTRTEANALRAKERELRAAARSIGQDSRRLYLDNLEYTVKELGGSRDKVAAFLPPDRRRWVEQTIEITGEYLGDDADGMPVFSDSRIKRQKRAVTYDPRTGVPVGLHTGAWGAAFDGYLDAQRTRWTRVLQNDPSRKDEASYYLDVIRHHETVKRSARAGTSEEEKILRGIVKRRADLDAKAEKLAAKLQATRERKRTVRRNKSR